MTRGYVGFLTSARHVSIHVCNHSPVLVYQGKYNYQSNCFNCHFYDRLHLYKQKLMDTSGTYRFSDILYFHIYEELFYVHNVNQGVWEFQRKSSVDFLFLKTWAKCVRILSPGVSLKSCPHFSTSFDINNIFSEPNGNPFLINAGKMALLFIASF